MLLLILIAGNCTVTFEGYVGFDLLGGGDVDLVPNYCLSGPNDKYLQ